MPREGKFEACIPGNHGKREFPLTPASWYLVKIENNLSEYFHFGPEKSTDIEIKQKSNAVEGWQTLIKNASCTRAGGERLSILLKYFIERTELHTRRW